MSLLLQILTDLGLSSGELPEAPVISDERRAQMRWRTNAAWQLRQQLRWAMSVPEQLWRTQGDLPPERDAIRTRMLWMLEVIESCWHEAAHALAAQETGQEWKIAWTPGETVGSNLPRIWGVTICTDADGKTRLPALLEVALAPSHLTITSGPSGDICTELSADDAEAAAQLLRHMGRQGGIRLPWKRPQQPRVRSGDDRWPPGTPERDRLIALARTALERWPHDLHSAHGQQLKEQTIEQLLERSSTRPSRMTRAIMDEGVPPSDHTTD